MGRFDRITGLRQAALGVSQHFRMVTFNRQHLLRGVAMQQTHALNISQHLGYTAQAVLAVIVRNDQLTVRIQFSSTKNPHPLSCLKRQARLAGTMIDLNG